MALIKNIQKKEDSVRFAVTFPESVLRRFDAYRLYLESETTYLPTRAEAAEQFFKYVFAEDKGFGKWYRPEDATQAAAVEALAKKDATAQKQGESASLDN